MTIRPVIHGTHAKKGRVLPTGAEQPLHAPGAKNRFAPPKKNFCSQARNRKAAYYDKLEYFKYNLKNFQLKLKL